MNRQSFILASLLGAFGFLTPVDGMAQNSAPQARYYYAIENLDSGAVVRRGAATSAGIPPFSLILAPETNYREWLYAVDTALIGSVDFRSPSAGQPLQIPAVPLGLPSLPDSDGDGLSDDAEFVIGTNPRNPDTDGDGIKDGAAVKLGIDPATASRTGIIGSVTTPGAAVDVCAFNDIVITADSAKGISVFNVFNRMNPLIIAQVQTPGTATSVACSGDFIAVADGAAGLTVVDIKDPPNARIAFQGGVGGFAQAVAAVGDLAFVGTREGNLTMVELSTGTALQTLNLGGNIYDVGVSGELLFVLVNSELRSYRFVTGPLELAGSVAVSGFPPEGITGRRRLFVGGTHAFVTSYPGFDSVDITNPAAMRLLGKAVDRVGANSFKQVVEVGAGLAVATVGANPRDDGTHDLYVYNTSDLTVTTNLVVPLLTPGIARAVAIYNALAYVADSDSGLQVMSVREVDFLGKPPAGTLTSTSTNGTVVEGARLFLRASVQDDVQVRNVEFYVDGVKLATDGNFPFELGWRAPAESAGRKFKFTAIASDTGGNQTTLSAIELTAVPDSIAPTVTIDSPAPTQAFFVGDDLIVKVSAFDNVGVASIEFKLDGQVVQAQRKSLNEWLVATSLSAGKHTLTVTARDYSGFLSAPSTRQFSVLKEAISREVSVFNFGPPDRPEAISREVSTFNFGPPDKPEAISREISTFNFGPLDKPEAISREISVENKKSP